MVYLLMREGKKGDISAVEFCCVECLLDLLLELEMMDDDWAPEIELKIVFDE